MKRTFLAITSVVGFSILLTIYAQGLDVAASNPLI